MLPRVLGTRVWGSDVGFRYSPGWAFDPFSKTWMVSGSGVSGTNEAHHHGQMMRLQIFLVRQALRLQNSR